MSGTRFALARLSLLVMGKMLARRAGSAKLSFEAGSGLILANADAFV